MVVTVDLGTGGPDLARAADRLGVPVEDIDTSFGLLPVEIGGHVYAVRVKIARLKLPRPGVEGPFSDPQIEPSR